MEIVRYEQNVFHKVDRAVAVARNSLFEYRAALDIALASDVALATLGPEYHPEVIVRRFLSALRDRLAQIAPVHDPARLN